jgi:hypothetical protein
MSVIHWGLRHILLIWGLLAFIVGMAVVLLDLQYDSGDVGGLVHILFTLLGQPAFVAAWLLGKFGMAIQDSTTQYVALALGLIGCIAADLAIHALLRRARSEANADRERSGRRL